MSKYEDLLSAATINPDLEEPELLIQSIENGPPTHHRVIPQFGKYAEINKLTTNMIELDEKKEEIERNIQKLNIKLYGITNEIDTIKKKMDKLEKGSLSNRLNIPRKSSNKRGGSRRRKSRRRS